MALSGHPFSASQENLMTGTKQDDILEFLIDMHIVVDAFHKEERTI
jgi:hypothetical protein